MRAVIRWLRTLTLVPSSAGVFSRVLGLLLLAGLLAYYVPARPQSFVISAKTEVVRVETIEDSASEWEVPRIDLCLKRAAPDTEVSTTAWCPSNQFQALSIEDAIVRWTGGYTLTVRSFEDGFLDILVSKSPEAPPVRVSNSPEITDASRLRIPLMVDGDRALLPMRGYTVIGDVPNRSDSLLLREARYEVRQKLGLGRKESIVVEDGTLFPGDRIGFAIQNPPFWIRLFQPASETSRDNQDVPARLFVTALSATAPAFDLVATTEPRFSALRVTRIGGQPTLIEVSWTQRLIADALPVAVATVLGLMGSIIALGNAYATRRKATPNTSKDQ